MQPTDDDTGRISNLDFPVCADSPSGYGVHGAPKERGVCGATGEFFATDCLHGGSC